MFNDVIVIYSSNVSTKTRGVENPALPEPSDVLRTLLSTQNPTEMLSKLVRSVDLYMYLKMNTGVSNCYSEIQPELNWNLGILISRVCVILRIKFYNKPVETDK